MKYHYVSNHSTHTQQLGSPEMRLMKTAQDTLETAVSAGASKMTGAGSVVTLAGWFTSSNIGMWVGILIGISGLVINWYFKSRSDRRAQEAHRVFMTQMEKKKILVEPPVLDSDY